MARGNPTQSSFTAGELSPRVLGRTDIDRYQQGLKRCRNAHTVVQGGVKRRAGTRYTVAAAVNTNDGSVLVPFIAGRASAWMCEFSDASVRIYSPTGALVVTLASPYLLGQLSLIDYAQSDTTLYLFHPAHPVQRLQRFSGGTWALSPAPFTTIPFAEVGVEPGVSATLSAATVGTGRTLTAASATFLAADVGRAVLSEAGIAAITGFTSTTVVTVTITRAFAGTALAAGAWNMDSSPQTTCTPSAKDPVGATITLTLAANGWRTGDIGSTVRLNGGLCRITAYTSALIVSATILRELSATVAAPALAWSLEQPVWSATLGYPRTGTVYQQRLIAAGTTRYPRTVWGSRIGEPLDFEQWTNDADAFSFTIDSDDASPIAYVTGANELVVLTESGELSMRGGVEKPITPTNVRVKPESNHGCAQVRPVRVNREEIFVQRAGRKVRAMGYRYDFDGFTAPDITALADHLTVAGIRSLAYQQEVEQLVWAARGDGQFMSCTFDRDQQPSVVGWALHTSDGFVEMVASIPDGDRDALWMLVRRTINGAAVRYIERLDESFVRDHPSAATIDSMVYGFTVDCGIVFDDAVGLTEFSVPHLTGKQVDIVADGAKQPRQTVPVSGNITISRLSKRTLIGLPFRTEITLLTPEMATNEGGSQGAATRTGEVVLKFLNTIGGKIVGIHGRETQLADRRLGPMVLDAPPQSFDEPVSATLLGWDKARSEISIVQDDPLPMHLLSVTRKHTANN